MIDLTIKQEQLKAVQKFVQQKNIVIPTLKQQRNPELIATDIKEKLKTVSLWEVNPLNLFRITWKNEPVPSGGGFGGVNFLELPSALTGVDARIIGLVGKWFPTGAHKVGATFGCLIPPLITGQFNPQTHQAVWPSTGNYCRGGAYNAALLGCESIAILPEGMSKERFNWLEQIAGEIIATSGSESNVKEIFDKCWELLETRDNVVIFNQFDELGNYLWHYHITGSALTEVVASVTNKGDKVGGLVLTTGSAGTIAAGDYLKQQYPHSKLAAAEALQCPTLLNNGFGDHRIEGIGDKHVPWIHNIKNLDMVLGIDDEDSISIMRLFNEEAGQKYLQQQGIDTDLIARLPEMGISSIANMIGAIKFAKYYELDKQSVVLTVFTDSMEMYNSRLVDLRAKQGEYSAEKAAVDYFRLQKSLKTDFTEELNYHSKKRIHNLKYFTWIEQQGKELAELNAQWYDAENYWGQVQNLADQIDELIIAFNQGNA